MQASRIFIFLLLFSGVSKVLFSQSCYEKLLNNQDSQAYYINVDEIVHDKELSQEQKAIQILEKFLNSQDCLNWINLENMKNSQIQCELFFGEHKVCMLKTKQVFFHIARDYVDGAMVIINRWD